MHGIFTEISLVVVLAGVLGIVVNILRQPAIVGYVIAGLIVGPLGLVHLSSTEVINSLSEIGITLLLFMVGLELSLKDLKQVGPVALVVGLAQITVMTTLGAFVFNMAGLPLQTALYLGFGIGISSTIIAVKIISEKKDLESLYGKIVLGILVVEDIVSILALALISGFIASDQVSVLSLLTIVGKLLVLFILAIVAGKYIFPKIIDKLGRSQEHIFLFSLAWGLGFATLISQGLFDLTPEIGGFLAGLTLANSSQHLQISNRIRPLRDFFLILFFIVLGSQLVIEGMGEIIWLVLGVVTLGVLVKPMFTFIFLSLFGHKGRVSFLSATSLAHISEFSIVLAVLGFKAGHLDESNLSVMTLSTILSFLVASYLMSHNGNIAGALRWFFRWWDGSSKVSGNGRSKAWREHVVLIGAHRTGQSVIHSLEDLKENFVVVDFNPSVIKHLSGKEVDVVFGDITDPDLQDRIRLPKARLIISTVPDYQDGLVILEAVKKHYPKPKIVLSATSDWEAKKLYEKGADYVLMPQFLTGLQLAELLKKDYNLKSISKLKHRDLELIDQTG